MVHRDTNKFIKYFLNIENNLLLFYTRNKESILITNNSIIDLNFLYGGTCLTPLYINI